MVKGWREERGEPYPHPDDFRRVRRIKKGAKGHTHVNERGTLVKCYHECRTLASDWKFWIGMTLGFPLEHALWEHVPGFSHITHWLGL